MNELRLFGKIVSLITWCVTEAVFCFHENGFETQRSKCEMCARRTQLLLLPEHPDCVPSIKIME